MKIRFLYLLLLAAIVSCQSNKTNEIVEESDPYLWLEDIEGQESLDWVREQNAKSEEAIKNSPIFQTLKAKFQEAYNDTDRIAYPSLVGNYVYNLWKDETNVRGVWRRMLTEDYIAGKTDWEVMLDLDLLSSVENKKWVFKGVEWLEPDNNRCLISISDGGKDESETREFDVTTKSFIDDGFNIPESKGGAAWIDSNTLLVGTDFGPGSMTTSGYPRMVKIWKRNTPLSDAELVMEGDSTVVGVWPSSSFVDGRQYTFIVKARTFYTSDFYFMVDGEFQKIEIPEDANLSGIHKNQMLLSLQSDWTINDKTFPIGDVVSFDFDKFINGDAEVQTVYSPDELSSFEGLNTLHDFIIVSTIQNVKSKLLKYRYNSGAWEMEEMETPEFSSVYIRSTSDGSNDYFYSYSNFITPTTLVYSDGENNTEIKKSKEYFDTSNLTIDQFSANSKDGTVIPYFVVHSKDMVLNGENLTLISAYGGFNIAQRPNYNLRTGIGLIERGGVYVVANIRGGGEFGPEWHKAAMREKRQNAYDDFFAVSEDLIARKITSPEHLGAYGWSNGGLLMGVVLTQRPDLYNAIVVGAPLLDMKRYSKMLAGASWMGEYGNPDVPEDWDFIKKYSPYQNVSKDKEYPQALFVTSTKDDRVHPGHARKMAAKMMDMGHPLYYYETIEGGHGAASTNDQQAEMWALVYTYLNMKLNNQSTSIEMR